MRFQFISPSPGLINWKPLSCNIAARPLCTTVSYTWFHLHKRKWSTTASISKVQHISPPTEDLTNQQNSPSSKHMKEVLCFPLKYPPDLWYVLSYLTAYRIHRTPADRYHNLQTCHTIWKENHLNYSSTLKGSTFKFK